MGNYKRISKVIGIYISLCLLLSCSGNTKKYNDLQIEPDDLDSLYNEMQKEKQKLVEKSIIQWKTINDITKKLADISNQMPSMRYNAESGYSKMTQADQIDRHLSAIENELQKARSGELDNEQLVATIKNLQLIVKSQQKEISVLRTVNNAWVAFNKNDYEKAYSLFMASDDESSKRNGGRAFQNKALKLIAARNGECDDIAKSFLLQAQKLNNSQEIRDLISKYK
jgi:archaellum component FlaC